MGATKFKGLLELVRREKTAESIRTDIDLRENQNL